MDRRHLTLALASLVVTGCSSRALNWESQARPQRVPARGGTHTVRAGETLYSIAFRYGLNHKSLARWNGLADPTLIYPGQRLRLSQPPTTARTAPSQPSTPKPKSTPPKSTVTSWRWPTDGRVVARFDPDAKVPRTGLLIGGELGQPVVATAAGEVVYSGSALKGYGKLVIVQHDARYLSAYGYNADLLVAEGDRVKAGQRIASMGETAARRPRLHFEIRLDAKPVDPLSLLKPR